MITAVRQVSVCLTAVSTVSCFCRSEMLMLPSAPQAWNLTHRVIALLREDSTS